jgi:hypothetical protein
MGSAIAHRIIGTSPVIVKNEAAETTTPFPPEYIRCMKESFNDKEICKEYLMAQPK